MSSVELDGLEQKVRNQVSTACSQLLELTEPEAGNIFVLGCSTSEISGKRIGSASSMQLAAAVVDPLLELVSERGLYLAVQCCEHLNRTLVVPGAGWRTHRLQRVAAIPHKAAGGACAERAYHLLCQPVLVENIWGQLGVDIGSTLIGMHLAPVVIPVRLKIEQVGQARLVAAWTRPKLIGGCRARYPQDIGKGPRRAE